MRNAVAFLFLTLGVQLAAQAFPAEIKSLSCSAVSGGSGATSVMLVGSFAGKTYVNITNVNRLGLPFTQQAEVLDVSLVGNSLVIDLYTVLTHGRLRLSLENGTNLGTLSATRSASDAIPMACAWRVEAER